MTQSLSATGIRSKISEIQSIYDIANVLQNIIYTKLTIINNNSKTLLTTMIIMKIMNNLKKINEPDWNGMKLVGVKNLPRSSINRFGLNWYGFSHASESV